MAYFCLIYIYISLFFFFWYILLWIPACLELIFLSLKKEFTLSVFLFVLFRNHQILDKVGTITLWKNSLRTHRMDFAAFSRAIRNWWEKPYISHEVKYNIRCESDGRKVYIRWAKRPPYQFFPCNFYKVGTSPQNCLTFSFNHFPRLV